MKECFYCGNQHDDFNLVEGYEFGTKVTACKHCADIEPNFIKSKNSIDEVFMRFDIKYTEKGNPVIIHCETICTMDFYSAYEYAKDKYGKNLVGIEFDEYVNNHGKDLSYDEKTKTWSPLF